MNFRINYISCQLSISKAINQPIYTSLSSITSAQVYILASYLKETFIGTFSAFIGENLEIEK